MTGIDRVRIEIQKLRNRGPSGNQDGALDDAVEMFNELYARRLYELIRWPLPSWEVIEAMYDDE